LIIGYLCTMISKMPKLLWVCFNNVPKLMVSDSVNLPVSKLRVKDLTTSLMLYKTKFKMDVKLL